MSATEGISPVRRGQCRFMVWSCTLGAIRLWLLHVIQPCECGTIHCASLYGPPQVNTPQQSCLALAMPCHTTPRLTHPEQACLSLQSSARAALMNNHQKSVWTRLDCKIQASPSHAPSHGPTPTGEIRSLLCIRRCLHFLVACSFGFCLASPVLGC